MLVIDDHELVRLGLHTLANSHARSSGQALRIFEARTLEEALGIFQDHQELIDLILLDLHLPDADRLSGLSTFLSRFPAARIIVLSGSTETSLARDAVKLGAIAYFSKSAELPNVMNFLRPEHRLGCPETSSKAPEMPATVREVKKLGGPVVALSTRQAQVFDAILAGQSNREIAGHMQLREGTVKNHVSTLLLLFGARSRAQLISQLR